MGKGDFLELAVLDTLRGAAWPPYSSVFVSLHTADPGDLGTSEVAAGGGYARVEVPCVTGSWSDPAAARPMTCQVSVSFPAATAGWGTVTHFGIWTQAAGGGLLYHGAITTPRVVLSGDLATTFAPGALTLDET